MGFPHCCGTPKIKGGVTKRAESCWIRQGDTRLLCAVDGRFVVATQEGLQTLVSKGEQRDIEAGSWLGVDNVPSLSLRSPGCGRQGGPGLAFEAWVFCILGLI
jgi:hypothetical protein